MYYLIFLILICGTVESTLGNLETVEDDALIDHIRNEKYLVVLFSKSKEIWSETLWITFKFFLAKKDCGECMNIENELIGLREMLVEELDAWVVKVENSQMTRLYSSPAIEPVLVFFRHGIPLVYHGIKWCILIDIFCNIFYRLQLKISITIWFISFYAMKSANTLVFLSLIGTIKQDGGKWSELANL